MIYFKTVSIDGDADVAETAIRKAASKRHIMLDLQTSTLPMGTDKSLMGLENSKSIFFARFRSHIHLLLPRLIIRFSKEKGFTEYQVRYSLLSFLVFAILSIALLLNCFYAIFYSQLDDDMFTVAMYLFVFLLLTAVELAFTKKQIEKILTVRHRLPSFDFLQENNKGH